MILEPHGVKTLKRRICSEGWEENEKNPAPRPCTAPVPGNRGREFNRSSARAEGTAARGKHEPRVRVPEVYKLQKFRSN